MYIVALWTKKSQNVIKKVHEQENYTGSFQ